MCAYRHRDDRTLMIFKDLEILSSLEVPTSDGMIRRSRKQYLAPLVDGHARDGSSVFLERLQRFG